MEKSSKYWAQRIGRIKGVNESIRFLKRIQLPGFGGLSLWDVLKFFVEGIMKGGLATRSAAISFRIFLAFFPAIIMLLSLIPLIPIPDFQKSLFDSIRTFFPGDTFSLFESTLDDLINQKHNTLLSVGFILVIYYASSSINAILLGFSESYHLEEKGNPIVLRIASIVLIFVLGLIMTVAVLIIIFSSAAFDWLHEHRLIGDKGFIPLLNFAKWIISMALVYTVFSTLYYVGVGTRKRPWKFINVGATFSTVFFVIASMAFAYFVNNFAQFNKLYGSLGTLMVLLIWLNFNCTILLLGFELNLSIKKARRIHRTKPLTVITPIVPRNTLRSADRDEGVQ
jgi:membrane protein